MKVDEKSLETARKLLSELSNLEDAFDVLSNYDVTVSARFFTGHNNNTKNSKIVNVPLSKDLIQPIVANMKNRIFEIKKELENL